MFKWCIKSSQFQHSLPCVVSGIEMESMLFFIPPVEGPSTCGSGHLVSSISPALRTLGSGRINGSTGPPLVDLCWLLHFVGFGWFWWTPCCCLFCEAEFPSISKFQASRVMGNKPRLMLDHHPSMKNPYGNTFDGWHEPLANESSFAPLNSYLLWGNCG